MTELECLSNNNNGDDDYYICGNFYVKIIKTKSYIEIELSLFLLLYYITHISIRMGKNIEKNSQKLHQITLIPTWNEQKFFPNANSNKINNFQLHSNSSAFRTTTMVVTITIYKKKKILS